MSTKKAPMPKAAVSADSAQAATTSTQTTLTSLRVGTTNTTAASKGTVATNKQLDVEKAFTALTQSEPIHAMPASMTTNTYVRVEDVPENEDSSDDEVVEVEHRPSRRHKAAIPKNETAEEELGALFQFTQVQVLTSLAARLSRDWSSVVYAFYHPDVKIHEANGKRAHVFRCLKGNCNARIRRWLDKTDKHSTGNLRKHVKACWGEEALASADALGSAQKAREGVKSYVRSGDLTLAFKRTGKGKITYSVRQHSRTETR